jgi:hypothetical protein
MMYVTAVYRPLKLYLTRAKLISRLNAHELANSRAFSTAIDQSKRPSVASDTAPQTVRHFNTSRSLKAVNDSSTIDFAYLPNMAPDLIDDEGQVRVPIIPTNFSPPRTGAHAPEQEEVSWPTESAQRNGHTDCLQIVHRPEISTMSLDAVYLPMSDLSDGHSLNIDFHAMADRVAANLRRMKVPVEEQAGLMKQLWNDMVDDITGSKKAGAV